MLKGLKRLFGGVAPTPAVPEAWEGLAAWATGRGCSFRPVGDDGFVIDGRHDQTAWRLEWGPSQRSFIEGPELRIRCDLRLGTDLHCLIIDRPLQQSLEAAVFDEYVEGVQTRIDTETPPEIRWLVMFPKLSGSDMPALRERYAALASVKPWLVRWLQGPLTEALLTWPSDPASPLVLSIGRGRLTLRTPLPVPDMRPLQSRLRLFECALREAERVKKQGVEGYAEAKAPGPDPAV